MSQADVRRILRWSHIFGALVLGTYLYSPWGKDPLFSAVVLYGLIPAMVLSGLWMWHQGRVSRFFRPPPKPAHPR